MQHDRVKRPAFDQFGFRFQHMPVMADEPHTAALQNPVVIEIAAARLFRAQQAFVQFSEQPMLAVFRAGEDDIHRSFVIETPILTSTPSALSSATICVVDSSPTSSPVAALTAPIPKSLRNSWFACILE